MLTCAVKLKPAQRNKHREDLSGERMNISNTVLLSFLALEIFQKTATMMEPALTTAEQPRVHPLLTFLFPWCRLSPFLFLKTVFRENTTLE